MLGENDLIKFLKKYFDKFKFQTLTTEDFIKYLNEYLIQPNELRINLEEWIYGPGIPENLYLPDSEKFIQVEGEIEKFYQTGKPDNLQTGEWTTHEWLHFIRHLKPDSNDRLMKKLDQTFGFSDSGNSEILAAWFELSIKNGYAKQILPKIEAFLVRIGRRKFLTPLYRAMKENGLFVEAKNIYEKARPGYHSVSRGTMDALLDWEGKRVED